MYSVSLALSWVPGPIQQQFASALPGSAICVFAVSILFYCFLLTKNILIIYNEKCWVFNRGYC